MLDTPPNAVNGSIEWILPIIRAFRDYRCYDELSENVDEWENKRDKIRINVTYSKNVRNFNR
jgi:hypothetical protein